MADALSRASVPTGRLPPSSPAKPVTLNGQTGVFPTLAYRQAGLSLFDPFHHNTNKKASKEAFYLCMLGLLDVFRTFDWKTMEAELKLWHKNKLERVANNLISI
jgi:hypothetical protein